jgi:hypothetical protein
LDSVALGRGRSLSAACQRDMTKERTILKIKIGDVEFGKKSEAEAHVRSILLRYDHMRPLEGADLAFVVAILDSHPNREVIVDCGIQSIVVQHLNDRYDSRRFLLKRTDKSIRDFTWRHAIYPRSARQRVMKACRWAVKGQIEKFKQEVFSTVSSITCIVSGVEVHPAESDVDHVPPRTFEALVDAWLSSLHMEADDVALVPVAGYEQPDRWEDTFLRDNWCDYHKIHADLRVISSAANRSTVRKQANAIHD